MMTVIIRQVRRVLQVAKLFGRGVVRRAQERPRGMGRIETVGV